MKSIGIAAVVLLALPAHAQPQLPDNGEPLRFARIADVPRLLVHAVGRDRCQLLDSILREAPVVIFRPTTRFAYWMGIRRCPWSMNTTATMIAKPMSKITMNLPVPPC